MTALFERERSGLGQMVEIAMLEAVLLPPTLAHLEDPGLADELAQARAVTTEPIQITQVIAMLSGIASSRLVIVG